MRSARVANLTPGIPYNQNVDTRPLLTVGAWHDIEVVFDAGHVDGRDGAVRMWVDGTQIIRVDGLAVRNSADNTRGNHPEPSTDAIFNMSWAPIFGSSVAKGRDDAILLDHLYVSGKN